MKHIKPTESIKYNASKEAMESELAMYKKAVAFMDDNKMKPCVHPLCKTCIHSVIYYKQYQPYPSYPYFGFQNEILFCSKDIQCDNYTKKTNEVIQC